MDPIQLIRHDHQMIERLFKRLEQALSGERPAAAAEALREVTRELSIHAAIEEQFLYPASRGARQDGDVHYASCAPLLAGRRRRGGERRGRRGRW